MVKVLVSSLRLDFLNNLLDVLHCILVGYQYRILGFNYDQIIHTDRGHKAILGIHQGTLSAYREHVPSQYIPILILVTHIPQGRPRPYIAPASIERDHGRTLGFFHHGVIDGVLRTGNKSITVNADKMHILFPFDQGLPARLEHIGMEMLEFIQIAAGAEHEHTAVPEIFTAFDIGVCSLKVRLFYKASNGKTTLIQIGPTLDIPITRFRVCRHNTEGY
ncbi:hypothetical protein D9M71_526650 [compost metagenome]